MKSWALSIIIVVFSITVISLLFPNGKIGKFIKSIFSLILVFVVLKPLISISDKNFSLEEFVFINETILQEDYIDFMHQKEIKQQEENCEKIFENLGITNAEIKLACLYDENKKLKIESVIINLKNAVIKSDKEHIVIIENAKKLITEYLNINYDVLVINE